MLQQQYHLSMVEVEGLKEIHGLFIKISISLKWSTDQEI